MKNIERSTTGIVSATPRISVLRRLAQVARAWVILSGGLAVLARSQLQWTSVRSLSGATSARSTNGAAS